MRITSSPTLGIHHLCRTLYTIADVLATRAGDAAGLRSGPAANDEWMLAIRLLNVSLYSCQQYAQ
jgi:hypothetical protein